MKPKNKGKIIFWCEFPEQVKWGQFQKYLADMGLQVSVYVAVHSIDEFADYYKKIRKKCRNVIDVGAWPLAKRSYWYSGYASKAEIDGLGQFRGVPIKTDIEPPKNVGSYSICNLFKQLLEIFKTAPNTAYLKKRILQLSIKQKIIISSFPFPEFLLKRIGWFFDKNLKYSYMFYTSFVPRAFIPFYLYYYAYFVRRMLKKHGAGSVFFAVGLIGKGVFGNEPLYKNIQQFKRDLQFLKCLGVKNFAVFELAGIMKREHAAKWFKGLKEIAG